MIKDILNHTFSCEDPELVSIMDELPLWSAPFGIELLNVINLKRDTIALDIGCGSGFPLIEIAMRLGKSGRVYGIDPWESALERARLKIRVLNLDNALVFNGIAEGMPFESDLFDLIVSNNGLNNVKDLKLSLLECARVSKPGAQMVMTMNLENTMTEFYNVFERILKENKFDNVVKKLKDHIYSKRKPLNEIKSLLKLSGFKIINTRLRSFEMNFLDGSTMLNHYLIKYWFLNSWKNVVQPDDQLFLFSEIEEELNIISSRKGFFSLSIPFVIIDCQRSQK